MWYYEITIGDTVITGQPEELREARENAADTVRTMRRAGLHVDSVRLLRYVDRYYHVEM